MSSDAHQCSTFTENTSQWIHDLHGASPRDTKALQNLKRNTPRPPRPASIMLLPQLLMPPVNDSMAHAQPVTRAPSTPRFRTPSSPAQSPPLPLPSVDSQVNNAIRGPHSIAHESDFGRRAAHVKHRLASESPESLPQENSQDSSMSSETSVLQQLTQSQDADVQVLGHNATNTVESLSKDGISFIDSYPKRQNEGEEVFQSEHDSGNVLLTPDTQSCQSWNQVPESYTQIDLGWSQVRPLHESSWEISRGRHLRSQASAEPTQPQYPSSTETEPTSPHRNRNDWRQSPSQDYIHAFRSGSMKIGSRSSRLSSSPMIFSNAGAAVNNEISLASREIMGHPDIKNVAPPSPSQSPDSFTSSVPRTDPFSHLCSQLQTQAPEPESQSFSQT
jgi:hypothetical protein